jgi:hypothetical protein
MLLDGDIGLNNDVFDSPPMIRVDDDDDMMFPRDEESQFSISRSVRSNASLIVHSESLVRTHEKYAEYVQEESQTTRRTGGGKAGVSVVPRSNDLSSTGAAFNTRARTGAAAERGRDGVHRPPMRQDTSSSSGAGSILTSRRNRFG